MQMNVQFPQEFEQNLQQSVIKVITETLGSLNSNSQAIEYMDKQQCASYLNVSVSTFNKWLKAEDIPVVIINGSYRFKKSEIDKFMLAKQK